MPITLNEGDMRLENLGWYICSIKKICEKLTLFQWDVNVRLYKNQPSWRCLSSRVCLGSFTLGFREWICNTIYIKFEYVIIHTYRNFNFTLVIPPLRLHNGCVITSDRTPCMQLLTHATISVDERNLRVPFNLPLPRIFISSCAVTSTRNVSDCFILQQKYVYT